MQKDQVRRGHPQLREVRPHRPHLISGSPCGWRCAAPGILVVMNTLAWCGSSGELRCDGALVIVVECQRRAGRATSRPHARVRRPPRGRCRSRCRGSLTRHLHAKSDRCRPRARGGHGCGTEQREERHGAADGPALLSRRARSLPPQFLHTFASTAFTRARLCG